MPQLFALDQGTANRVPWMRSEDYTSISYGVAQVFCIHCEVVHLQILPSPEQELRGVKFVRP